MSTPDLSREEAEKAFEKFEPGFYGSGNTYTDRRTTWLAAWSACAEKAAGVAETWPHPCKTHDQFLIAAEIRRKLGGK